MPEMEPLTGQPPRVQPPRQEPTPPPREEPRDAAPEVERMQAPARLRAPETGKGTVVDVIG